MYVKTSTRIVAALLAVFLTTLSGCALRIPLGTGPGQNLELQWFSPVQGHVPAVDPQPTFPASQPSG